MPPEIVPAEGESWLFWAGFSLFVDDERGLFLHSVGAPGLFAYSSEFA